MFYETTLVDKTSVVYTLKDWDHQVGDVLYPSLYLLYLKTNDPTEWRFATDHLDGWVHWEALLECNWFTPYVTRWRRELELRMKSHSLARIMAESKASSRDSFNANKYLLEKGWEPKESTSKRGRPSKDEIKAEANRLGSLEHAINADFDRINTRAN